MKNIFLFLLLLTAQVIDAQIPGYPLIDTTSEWLVRGEFVYFEPITCDNSFAITEITVTYFINGDTIFDGKTYYQIYREGFDTSHCTSNPAIEWTDYHFQLDGFLREEDQQLYTYSTSAGMEIPLWEYDTINIGDSLNPQCTVSGIDTLYLLNQPYLKYQCACESEFLIQGIGTKRLPFTTSLNCGIGIEGDYRNLCYRKQGFVIAVDTTSNCVSTGDTSLYVSATPVPKTVRPTIFPNPARDQVFISGLPEGQWSVRILSLTGTTVQPGTPLVNNELDVSRLEAGLYFLEIADGHNRILRRVIIQ